jgi:molecular chaperone GrpE
VSHNVDETNAEAQPEGSRSGEAAAPDAEASRAEAGEAGSDASEASDDASPMDTPPIDELADAIEEGKRLKDQLLRTAADFDNFRKRSRREVSEATERGREDLLKELLPVFDNLERATEHAKSATDVSALSDGIDLVIKQFVDTLSKLGVERVEAVGQVFDPALHEAIQQVETATVAPGTVANQVQAGYKMGGRLIRPCMVVVAKAASE